MKGKTAVVIMIMTLVISSTFVGASSIKNETSKSPVTMGDGTEIDVYGRDFYDIEGEWDYYGAHAIRMSPGNYPCSAYYSINIGTNKVEDGSLQVGIFFCDLGWFGTGPSFAVYNWDEQNYDADWVDVGNWDNLEWVWRIPPNSNAYVNDDGIVDIAVAVDEFDDTILDLVGVKFIPVAPPPPPEPDLDCTGSLSWTDVQPGSTVTGSFTVKNIGEQGSSLNWEVSEWPNWGTWTFSPEGGMNIPKYGTSIVQVTVVAPDQGDQQFSGEVKVVNEDDSNDYEIIPVSLATPYIQQNIQSQQSSPLVNPSPNQQNGQLFYNFVLRHQITK
jgi:hypothetical protein